MLATFSDTFELCCGYLRQRVEDFTITDFSAAAIMNCPHPWITYAFTVGPLALTETDVTATLLSTQGLPLCDTNFETWEAIEAKIQTSSCLSSVKGICNDFTALTTCSQDY